jgi:hypothetical protein
MIQELVELHGPVVSRWRGMVAFFDGEHRKSWAVNSAEVIRAVNGPEFKAWLADRPITMVRMHEDGFGPASLLVFGAGDADLEFRLRWL